MCCTRSRCIPATSSSKNIRSVEALVFYVFSYGCEIWTVKVKDKSCILEVVSFRDVVLAQNSISCLDRKNGKFFIFKNLTLRNVFLPVLVKESSGRQARFKEMQLELREAYHFTTRKDSKQMDRSLACLPLQPKTPLGGDVSSKMQWFKYKSIGSHRTEMGSTAYYNDVNVPWTLFIVIWRRAISIAWFGGAKYGLKIKEASTVLSEYESGTRKRVVTCLTGLQSFKSFNIF